LPGGYGGGLSRLAIFRGGARLDCWAVSRELALRAQTSARHSVGRGLGYARIVTVGGGEEASPFVSRPIDKPAKAGVSRGTRGPRRDGPADDVPPASSWVRPSTSPSPMRGSGKQEPARPQVSSAFRDMKRTGRRAQSERAKCGSRRGASKRELLRRRARSRSGMPKMSRDPAATASPPSLHAQEGCGHEAGDADDARGSSRHDDGHVIDARGRAGHESDELPVRRSPRGHEDSNPPGRARWMRTRAPSCLFPPRTVRTRWREPLPTRRMGTDTRANLSRCAQKRKQRGLRGSSTHREGMCTVA